MLVQRIIATKEILVMRHGEPVHTKSAFLADKRAQLTNRGYCQAYLSGQALGKRQQHPDLIIVSSMTRAQETATFLVDGFFGITHTRIPIETVDYLHEINIGSNPNVFKAIQSLLLPTKKYESIDAARERIQLNLTNILDRKNSSVLIIGHAGVNSIIDQLLLAQHSFMRYLQIPHCGIAQYTESSGSWIRDKWLNGKEALFDTQQLPKTYF